MNNLTILWLGAITIAAYFASIALQRHNLRKKNSQGKWLVFMTGSLAVILHAMLLHWRIDITGGQNLSFSNMFSLVIWLIALLLLISYWRKPIENLILFVFPLAIFSIVVLALLPQQYIVNTATDPKQLFHVLLAVLTFSVLSVAGLQAILLATQERQLRHKVSNSIFQKFPPLETMESLLFQMVWLGFILLSIMIATSLYFFHDRITLPLLQKIILAVFSWLIFGILLLGRYYYGWRGRKAIYGTLCGVLLIVIIYFGSVLLLGLLI